MAFFLHIFCTVNTHGVSPNYTTADIHFKSEGASTRGPIPIPKPTPSLTNNFNSPPALSLQVLILAS